MHACSYSDTVISEKTKNLKPLFSRNKQRSKDILKHFTTASEIKSYQGNLQKHEPQEMITQYACIKPASWPLNIRLSSAKTRFTQSKFRMLQVIHATVSDKNTWDTLAKRCFFPSRIYLVPLKVVCRGSVTKSCTPTLRGQGDPKVSQPFWLRLYFRGILGMWLLVGSSGGKSLGRYMHVSEPFFREKH